MAEMQEKKIKPSSGASHRCQLTYVPVCEGDERALLLRGLLWMLLVLGTLLFVLDLYYLPVHATRWSIALLSLVAITVPMLILLRKGYVNAVAVSLTVLLFFFITAMAATGGGIHAMITQGYLVLTIMAGLMGGLRYAILIGALSLIAEFGFVLFSDRIPPIAERTPMSRWLVNAFYLSTIILLQYYFIRSVQRLFHRSVQNQSDRRRAEENLFESEERFRAIFDQSILGVAITDLDGCVVNVNDAFCRMLGYSAAELDGRHFSEFTCSEDLPVEMEHVRQVLSGLRRSYTLEKRYIRKDRTLLPVSITVSLLRDAAAKPSACLGIVEDISERYSAEAALRASEELFRVTFENAGVGIALVDSEGYILRCNEALIDLTGFTEAELLERNLRDFTHRDDLDLDAALHRDLLDGKRERYMIDKRILRKDGTAVWARLTVTIVASYRSHPYSIAIIEDITEKKLTELEMAAYRDELEEMVRERTEELRSALQVAEAATLARNEFLASVSHELRTPMNGVLGLTHLALGTNLTSRQRDYLVKIKTAAQDLLGLLNDLLDFSKMEAGRFEHESVPFQIDHLISSVVDLVSVRAAEKNLQFRIHIGDSIPLQVVGDPVRLRQVLMNLVGNAVKFTETGSVTLLVEKKESDSAQIQLEFSIVDTGPGVPSSLRPHLFEPFRQADGSMTRRYGGTGLGLAICKHIVEQMGGTIGLDDTFVTGSRFYFSLPFSMPGDGEAMAEIPALDETAFRVSGYDTGRTEKMPLQGKVLVVEDNEINLQVALEMLQSLGLSVDIARNGVEGVQKAASGEYQAILMDLQMPLMDGYEASQQIRKRHPETPIVAMTAHATESVKQRCLAAGMNDHIPKPVDPDILYRILSRWLSLPARRESMRPTPETFDVAGFDVLSVVQRLDGDVVLFKRLLEYFVRDHIDDALQMEKALEQGDVKTVRHLIHNLRGAASNLSADEILSVLFDLDRHIEQNGWELQRLRPFIQRLKNALLASVQSIKKALVGNRPERDLQVKTSYEAPSLPLFDALLARQSLNARHLLERLRTDLERLSPGLPERIAWEMDRLDYMKAREVLAPYLETK